MDPLARYAFIMLPYPNLADCERFRQEIQGDWLTNLMKYAQNEHIECIEARPEAEEGWRQLVLGVNAMTLFANAKSSFNGANIENKSFEPLSFIGGLPL